MILIVYGTAHTIIILQLLPKFQTPLFPDKPVLHSYTKPSTNFIYLLTSIYVYYYYQPQLHGFFHQLLIIN
jgi:hypothetical protein